MGPVASPVRLGSAAPPPDLPEFAWLQVDTKRALGRGNSGSTSQGPRAQPVRFSISEKAERPPNVALAKTIVGVGLDQLARVFGHIVFIIEDDVARWRLGLSDDPRLDLTTT